MSQLPLSVQFFISLQVSSEQICMNPNAIKQLPATCTALVYTLLAIDEIAIDKVLLSLSSLDMIWMGFLQMLLWYGERREVGGGRHPERKVENGETGEQWATEGAEWEGR